MKDHLTISTKYGTKVRADHSAARIIAGTFDFSNNNTNGWVLEQLWDSDVAKKAGNQITPYALNGVSFGFALSATTIAATGVSGLMAGANTFFHPDHPKIKSFDIYLISPDLSAINGWAGRRGFAVDIERAIGGPFFGTSDFYKVQLQIVFADAKGKLHTYAESDKSGNPVSHGIPHTGGELIQGSGGQTTVPGKRSFSFKPNNKEIDQYQIRQLIIRLTQPNILGELAPKGDWFVTNVGPVA